MRYLLILFCLCIAACSSKPVIMTAADVKVGRENAKPSCRALGKLSGTTMSTSGTQEQALDDLKKEAAAKGANYVVIKEFSDYGTGVTGMAYDCP
jgi:uncharacterized protein YbjQ (UPF0145 family)